MSESGRDPQAPEQRKEARRLFWSDHSRRSYECPDCGRGLSQLRTTFEVHHKDGDYYNNDKENLIALCRPCHNLREGKKPSVNEIELMQQQIDNSMVAGGLTPLVESYEEADEVYKNDSEATQPHMVLKRINRRKYVGLEIDFNSAKGWNCEEGGGADEDAARPILTKDAVEAVNAVLQKYEGEKQPRNDTSALATNYGVDFISLPAMLPDVARRLAQELRPLVMNRDNWEIDSPPY